MKLIVSYLNTFLVFSLQFSIWSVFLKLGLCFLLLLLLCSSDLAVSKLGQYFCVLYKSWFLNVTDDCVEFRASYPSCQIVKAIVPPQAAGVTIQYCSWEATAFSSELLFEERSSSLAMGDTAICHSIFPSKGDPGMPAVKANLLQWISHPKYVSIYERSKGLVTGEFLSVFSFMRENILVSEELWKEF